METKNRCLWCQDKELPCGRCFFKTVPSFTEQAEYYHKKLQGFILIPVDEKKTK